MEDRRLIASRRATAAIFWLFGFALGMWVVYIPTIRDRTGASLHEVGVALLLLGGGSFVAMTLCSRLIGRVGSRTVVLAGGTGVSTLIIAPAVSHSPVTLMISTVSLGFFSGLQDVGQNAQGVEVERRFGRPIMASLHALYSVGGLVAAGAGALTLKFGLDIHVVFVSTALIGLLTTAWCARHFVPGQQTDRELAPRRSAGWTKRILLVGSLAFALLMAEGVAYDWSSIHLRDVLGADPSVAPAGFAAFTVSMVIMRFMSDRLVARIGPVTFVRAGTTVGAAGLLVAALSNEVPLAAVGWGVFGLGLAGCVPLTFTAAGSIDPSSSDTSVSRVSSLGYLGLLAGPSLIGFLAPQITLTGALFVPMACCAYGCLVAARAFSHTATAPNRGAPHVC